MASVWLILPAASFAACSPSGGDTVTDAGGEDARDVSTIDVGEGEDDEDEIPCPPRLVLQQVCQQCHSRPPRNGAPFPLVRRSDVLAARGSSVVRDLMIAEVESRRMPVAPVTIEDGERETLLEWLKGGAAAIPPQQCSEPDAGDADAAEDAAPDVDDSGDAPAE